MIEQKALQLILSSPEILKEIGFSDEEITAGVNPLTLSIDDPRRAAIVTKLQELISQPDAPAAPGIPALPRSFQQPQAGTSEMPVPDETVAQAQPISIPQGEVPPPAPETLPVPEMPVAPTQAPITSEAQPAPQAPQLPQPPKSPAEKNIRGSQFPKPQSAGAKKYESKFTYEGTGGLLSSLQGLASKAKTAVTNTASKVTTAVKSSPITKAVTTAAKSYVAAKTPVASTIAKTVAPAVKKAAPAVKQAVSTAASKVVAAAKSSAAQGPLAKAKASQPTQSKSTYTPPSFSGFKDMLGNALNKLSTTSTQKNVVKEGPVNQIPTSYQNKDTLATPPVTGITKIETTKTDTTPVVTDKPQTGAEDAIVADTTDTVVDDFVETPEVTGDFTDIQYDEFIPDEETKTALAQSLGPDLYAWNSMAKDNILPPEQYLKKIDDFNKKQFKVDELLKASLAQKKYYETQLPRDLEAEINKKDKVMNFIQAKRDFLYDQLYNVQKGNLDPGTPEAQGYGIIDIELNQQGLNALAKLEAEQVKSYDRIYNAITNKAQADVNSAIDAYESAYKKYETAVTQDYNAYKEYWDKTYAMKQEVYKSLDAIDNNANLGYLSGLDSEKEILAAATNAVSKGGEIIYGDGGIILGFYMGVKDADGKWVPDKNQPIALRDGLVIQNGTLVPKTSTTIPTSPAEQTSQSSTSNVILPNNYAMARIALSEGRGVEGARKAGGAAWYRPDNALGWFIDQMNFWVGLPADADQATIDAALAAQPSDKKILLDSFGNFLPGAKPGSLMFIDKQLAAKNYDKDSIKAMLKEGGYWDEVAEYYLDTKLTSLGNQTPAPGPFTKVGSDTKKSYSMTPIVIANSPIDPKTKQNVECVIYSRMFSPSLPLMYGKKEKRAGINTKKARVGAVALMPSLGTYGHTANVLAKYADGTILIEEANFIKGEKITRRRGTPAQLGIEGYYYNPNNAIAKAQSRTA